IRAWLTGGWGIDALLGQQTRPHKDLDLIVLVEDVGRIRDLLAPDGFALKEVWEENRWTTDPYGAQTATAFVLHTSTGREIDIHAMRLDGHGNGHPMWEAEGLVFESEDLAGEGAIAGVAVQCLGPQMQVLRHRGYELPDWQVRDLELLQERFGVEWH
ncbi:MAG: nucleotidyltransferase domain-containing protein, partial [Anaerolineales bacterium]